MYKFTGAKEMVDTVYRLAAVAEPKGTTPKDMRHVDVSREFLEAVLGDMDEGDKLDMVHEMMLHTANTYDAADKLDALQCTAEQLQEELRNMSTIVDGPTPASQTLATSLRLHAAQLEKDIDEVEYYLPRTPEVTMP